MSNSFTPPAGRIRGRRTRIFALHRQLFRKGQPCGKVWDYLFPGETRAEGQARSNALRSTFRKEANRG